MPLSAARRRVITAPRSKQGYPGRGSPAEEVPSLADQDACSAKTVGLNSQARTRESGAGRLMYAGACWRESRRCFSPGCREGWMP